MATSDLMAVFTPYANEPPATVYATLDLRNGHPVLDFNDTTAWSAIFTGSILADSLVEGMQRAGVSVRTRAEPEREPEETTEIATLLGKIGLNNKQRKALAEMGVKVPRTRAPKPALSRAEGKEPADATLV